MMIDWVDQELKAWGRFMCGGIGPKLSRESLEYKMMTYGPDSLISDSKGAPAPDPYVPDGVARAELILRSKYVMPAELRTVAIEVYSHSHLSREVQAKIVSRELCISVSERKLREMLGNLHHRYEAHVNVMDSYNKKYYNFMKKYVDNRPLKTV